MGRQESQKIKHSEYLRGREAQSSQMLLGTNCITITQKLKEKAVAVCPPPPYLLLIYIFTTAYLKVATRGDLNVLTTHTEGNCVR